MRGSIREPTDTKRIHQHPHVVNILIIHQWLGFFELLKGYDDDISHEFSMTLHPQGEATATTVIKGLVISLSPKL